MSAQRSRPLACYHEASSQIEKILVRLPPAGTSKLPTTFLTTFLELP
jgi:hypothetical protein